MRAIHAAKRSGKPEEVHHHISTALWLLEQYDELAGELNKLRERANERIGDGSADASKKVDGGEGDQEDPKKKRASLEEVIAWTTKRFQAVMITEDPEAKVAGTIEAGKFAWRTRTGSLLDMSPESIPMVAGAGTLDNRMRSATSCRRTTPVNGCIFLR